MSERIGLREYARRRGCTLRAVQKAIESKRIALIDGKIDPELADRQWKARTDPLQQLRGNGGVIPAAAETPPAAVPDLVVVPAVSRETVPAPTPAARADEETPERTSADGVGYSEAKAQGEWYRAQLYRLELDEKRGKLVPADEVRKAAFTRARVARDRLLALPTRVASLVAAESDAARCHEILEAEVRRICDELASGGAAESVAA